MEPGHGCRSWEWVAVAGLHKRNRPKVILLEDRVNFENSDTVTSRLALNAKYED